MGTMLRYRDIFFPRALCRGAALWMFVWPGLPAQDDALARLVDLRRRTAEERGAIAPVDVDRVESIVVNADRMPYPDIVGAAAVIRFSESLRHEGTPDAALLDAARGDEEGWILKGVLLLLAGKGRFKEAADVTVDRPVALPKELRGPGFWHWWQETFKYVPTSYVWYGQMRVALVGLWLSGGSDVRAAVTELLGLEPHGGLNAEDLAATWISAIEAEASEYDQAYRDLYAELRSAQAGLSPSVWVEDHHGLRQVDRLQFEMQRRSPIRCEIRLRTPVSQSSRGVTWGLLCVPGDPGGIIVQEVYSHTKWIEEVAGVKESAFVALHPYVVVTQNAVRGRKDAEVRQARCDAIGREVWYLTMQFGLVWPSGKEVRSEEARLGASVVVPTIRIVAAYMRAIIDGEQDAATDEAIQRLLTVVRAWIQFVGGGAGPLVARVGVIHSASQVALVMRTESLCMLCIVRPGGAGSASIEVYHLAGTTKSRVELVQGASGRLRVCVHGAVLRDTWQMQEASEGKLHVTRLNPESISIEGASREACETFLDVVGG